MVVTSDQTRPELTLQQGNGIDKRKLGLILEE